MTIRRYTNIAAHTVILFVLAVLLSSAVCAASQPAIESLKGTLDKIIDVLNDQSLRAPAKKNERREILLKLVQERFDEEEFARRALGAHWRERTNKEREEFVKAFSNLLQGTYLDKIDAYLAKAGSFSGKNIRYLNETVKRNYVIVTTKILTSDNAEIPVLYLFKNNQGNWLVCDVAIEGVSIAKNYRAQFKEILANSSFQELLIKLRSKKTELTEKK